MRARPLAALAPLLLAACGLDQIDVVVSGRLAVPGDPSAASLPYAPISFPVAAIDFRKLSGLRPSEIRSAHVRAVTVTVTEGTPLEQWVDSVALYLEAGGLPRVLVARKDGVGALPAGTTSLALDVVPGVDVAPILAAPPTLVVAEGTGRSPTARTVLSLAATVRVRLDLAGVL